MKRFKTVQMVVAVALVAAAVLLMIDGQILGQMTTNLSRVLLVTAIPLIATSKRSTSDATQRE